MTRGSDTYNGLVRRPTYEEILRAAVKKEKPGILSVPMQRYATRMINDPMFQRHQEAMTNELEAQTHRLIEHKTFENHVTQMSMEARINKDDMAFLLSHMGQGPSPPPPPSTRDSSSQYQSNVNSGGTQTDRDGMTMGTQTNPPPPPPPGMGIGTQTSRMDTSMGTQTDGQIPVMMGSGPPPPGPGGAPIIQQTSPQLVQRARLEAEVDGLAQEQARKAAIPRLQQQIEAQMQQQKATPQQRLIEAATLLRPVPKAPLQPAEEAYVAPSVRQPKTRASPYDQFHGPVAPGIRDRGLALTAGGGTQPRPPPDAPPVSASSTIVPKPKAAPKTEKPVAMTDSDKRGGPGGGGTGKKKKISEEIVKPPPKRKTDEDDIEVAVPKKVKPSSAPPVFPSKVRPSKAPVRPSQASAIEDETPSQSYNRKVVNVGRTQGKFVKSRRITRVSIPTEQAAQPPRDGDQEMVPRPFAAQGRKMISSVASGLREQAMLRMSQVMAQLRSTVSSTPTGLIMNRMVEQLRRNRGNVKGPKALGNRRGGLRR